MVRIERTWRPYRARNSFINHHSINISALRALIPKCGDSETKSYEQSDKNSGTYTLKNDTVPKEINLLVRDGKNIDEDNIGGIHEGIFKIAGDTLWFAFIEPGSARVSSFHPEEDPQSVVMELLRDYVKNISNRVDRSSTDYTTALQ